MLPLSATTNIAWPPMAFCRPVENWPGQSSETERLMRLPAEVAESGACPVCWLWAAQLSTVSMLLWVVLS